MSLSNLLKSISLVTGSLFISSILLPDSASAFSTTFTNQGFESGLTGWLGAGDRSIQTNSFQTAPVQGSSQALITTGHHTRVDDNTTAASTFNYSDTSPVSSTTNSSANSLQTSLGLPTNSLSIPRQNSANDSAFRTPKEGSGIYQDFSITIDSTDVTNGTNQFHIDFNEAFLTNDRHNSILGDQDFAFYTVFDTSSSVNSRTINVLDDSGGSSTNSTTSNFQNTNTTFYTTNNQRTYTSPSLGIGTYNYRIGFGVVDVDGVDRSSGLLVDNINVRQVPFEFSPSLGLVIVAGIFGCDRLRRQFKTKSDIKF